jgi:phenylalanyl-tRNA synthetase beta chain
MRASHKWLTELSGVDVPPQEMADRLTSAGVEVEQVEAHGGAGLEQVVVGEVRGKRAHPKRDKLTLVTVFDGQQEQEVVCGAPNVPDAGGRILFARLGATLPNGMTIEQRKIGGEVSRGMICSEAELDIGTDAEGIFVLDPHEHPAEVGMLAADALGLRDHVFEIGLTPNRPDCLGHIGLARDVAALYEKPFEAPASTPPSQALGADSSLVPEGPMRFSLGAHWSASPAEAPGVNTDGLGPVSVEIADPDRCPRYGAALVLGLDPNARSPFWLRYRLHLLGLRSVSPAVDVTNLVMLEWGHPIHGFDLERLQGRRIVVRRGRDGEKMTTLDHVERTFGPDDLFICDAERPVAVAGVMGGLDSEIGPETRHVLLECAYFDPQSVRRTSRRQGLHSDASHRFERGVDPNAVPAVLARSAALMQQVCGGSVVDVGVDAYPQPARRRAVNLRPSRVAGLLGTEVTAGQCQALLERLGCEVQPGSKDALSVTVPTWRPDLGREVDLVEEVARLQGYDAIPTEVPRIRPSAEGTPHAITFERRIRELATTAGLHETINYAFVSEQELGQAGVARDVVPLENPLSEHRAVMRTSLLPGLAANARHAQRRQVERIRLYELGRTFHARAGETLPEERPIFGMLLLGPRQVWIGEGKPHDFFDGKGALEHLVEPLVGRAPVTTFDDSLAERAPFLHPRRRATVEVAGVDVGMLGELHPDVTDALELTGRPIYAELHVGRLLDAEAQVGVPQARPLPKYPAVTRDIAMIASDEHPAGVIAQVLQEASEGLAESIELFDLYRGDPVPEGRRSLAFRVVYRDPDATLTDARVDEVHGRLARAAEERFGATLR